VSLRGTAIMSSSRFPIPDPELSGIGIGIGTGL